MQPDKFPDSAAFEEEYSMQTMDGVSALHAVLRPHLLRRVIKDVERSLPPKNERILRVEMTPLQRQYYKVGEYVHMLGGDVMSVIGLCVYARA